MYERGHFHIFFINKMNWRHACKLIGTVAEDILGKLNMNAAPKGKGTAAPAKTITIGRTYVRRVKSSKQQQTLYSFDTPACAAISLAATSLYSFYFSVVDPLVAMAPPGGPPQPTEPPDAATPSGLNIPGKSLLVANVTTDHIAFGEVDDASYATNPSDVNTTAASVSSGNETLSLPVNIGTMAPVTPPKAPVAGVVSRAVAQWPPSGVNTPAASAPEPGRLNIPAAFNVTERTEAEDRFWSWIQFVNRTLVKVKYPGFVNLNKEDFTSTETMFRMYSHLRERHFLRRPSVHKSDRKYHLVDQ